MQDHEYELGEVRVRFPYAAYDCQVKYMRGVVEALSSRRNALLESPTGTGKTLALLCAALAWQEHRSSSAGAEDRDPGAAATASSPPSPPSGSSCLSGSSTATLVPDLEDLRPPSSRVADGPVPDPAADPSRRRRVLPATAMVAPAPARPAAAAEKSAAEGPRAAVIYCSRTHSQLRQVVAELAKTTYNVRYAVLGSRKQLCVHPEVSVLRGAEQDARCRALTRAPGGCSYLDEGSCPFFEARRRAAEVPLVLAPYNYLVDPRVRKSLPLPLRGAVVLFDEAHNLTNACEEATSFRFSAADLAGMARGLQETVKVFDGLALGVYQFGDARVADALRQEKKLAAAICEACEYGEDVLGLDAPVNDAAEVRAPELDLLTRACPQLVRLERILALLEAKVRGGADYAALGGEPVVSGWKLDVRVLRDWIAETFPPGLDFAHLCRWIVLLAECHLQFVVFYRAALGPAQGFRARADSRAAAAGGRMDLAKYSRAAFQLSELGDLIEYLYLLGLDEAEVRASYRVYIGRESPATGLAAPDADASGNPTDARTLFVWSFGAAVAMKLMMREGVRSVVLTSGTLSPLDSLEYELGLLFPLRLENEHVVGPSQVWAGVIPRCPTGQALNSSYRLRSSTSYPTALGATIVSLTRIIPGGVLVFFPSYSAMDESLERWRSATMRDGTTMWDAICRNKHPVVEPRDPFALAAAIDDYKSRVLTPYAPGAVFFAVCRGKVSEGLDFADAIGRAVIVTGLPYPQVQDPRVLLKRMYCDERASAEPTRAGSAVLRGTEWYSQQATRAVNQAVGRVIRHRNDYGAIILVDERFEYPNSIASLSKWLRGFIRVHPTFTDAAVSLTAFFKTRDADAVPAVMVVGDRPLAAADSRGPMANAHPPVALSAPQPRVQSAASQARSAQRVPVKGYLQLLRGATTAEAYDEFVQNLKDYTVHKIGLPELVEGVDRIFLGLEASVSAQVVLELRVGFLEYLPARSREVWLDRWMTLYGGASTSAAAVAAAAAATTTTATIVSAIASTSTPSTTATTHTTATTLATTDGPLAKRARLEPAAAAASGADAGPPDEEFSLICVICRERYRSPHVSPCGHVACSACWRDWLGTTLECPVCRERVRAPQLIKLFL